MVEIKRSTLPEEQEQMQVFGYVVDLDSLALDIQAIMTEAVFSSRWALVEGYWLVGQRIRQDTNKWAQGSALAVLDRLQTATGIGQRTLYYATRFYDQFPDLSALPEGKNISWSKIKSHYLRDLHGDAKALPETFVGTDPLRQTLRAVLDQLTPNADGLVLTTPRGQLIIRLVSPPLDK
jgi:hypothetical protein